MDQTHQDADYRTVLKFGRICARITGNAELIGQLHPNWQKFLTDGKSLSVDVSLRIEKVKYLSGESDENGWSLCKAGERNEAVYSENGRGIFSLQYQDTVDGVVVMARSEVACKSAQLGVQFGLLIALHRECVGLHGVTLLCGDEVIILSAPSGTGKTTLAKLLEMYSGAIVINGDFALLTPTKEGLVFEPTPFCGTSGRCLNHRVRVDRVVFLDQSPINRWRNLDGRETIARFLSNAFVPIWDERLKETVYGNVLKSVSMIKVNAFAFAPVREAAELFSQMIQ